ncbi:MAG: hypothetical protein HY246_00290 [Proteobacteria bacterium]|nr:hypothetical protein [Pseudomonadota bacterium]
MIRLSTVLWLGLAGVVGLGLYHLKHEVRALESELARLNRAILIEQQAAHVLRAEWSYINQPQRLESLASRYLDLQPIKPVQLGRFADVPMPLSPGAPSALLAVHGGSVPARERR